MNLGSSNESDVENEITTNVTNNLEMSVEKNLSNMILQKVVLNKKRQLIFGVCECEGSNIVINQNQALEVVAENLAETINDVVQSGEAVTKVVNEQTQSVKQTNEGWCLEVGESSSSCSSVILSAVLAGAAPMIQEAMEKKKGSLGGGAGMTEPLVGPKKGVNKGVLIGVLLAGTAILLLILVILKLNTH